MQTFLNINTIFFTVLGYQMSYIEFFGTLLNIACVYLASRNKILNWPIGIAGTVLFGVLFWQIQLYADVLEQVYFLITGFWGWFAWSQIRKKRESRSITTLPKNMYFLFGTTITVGTILLGYVTSNLHVYLPQFFPTPASFAYLDSFTTVLSFSATVLMIRRQLDAWYLWIVVDIIGIGLYWVKGVHFVALLYALFLVMAIQGLYIWLKLYKNTNKNIV